MLNFFKKKPPVFFSIIIPTRDRPWFVKASLEALQLQTYKNFEVIISDNYAQHPCKDAVMAFGDRRFKYITPGSDMNMVDHWEFACSHANGDYVSVLIDKTFFQVDALKVVASEIGKWEDLDIITGWSESCVPIDENEGYSNGYFNPQFEASAPEAYNPREELARRFDCKEDLWGEGLNYYRGKICFGMYSKKLIERIKVKMGRLFVPLFPDYSTSAAALALANNAIDIGQPLIVSFLTSLSNGMNCYRSPKNTKAFIETIDTSGKLFDDLPVKSVYASIHNCAASDYERVRSLLGTDFPSVSLNLENLAKRMLADLSLLSFSSEEEKNEQLGAYLPVSGCRTMNDLELALKEAADTNPLNAGLSIEEQKEIYEALYFKFTSHLEVAKEIARHYNPKK